jgi:hypothetical protein
MQYTRVDAPIDTPVEEDEIGFDFTINDGVVSFPLVDEEDVSYTLYLYSNSDKLKSYPLTAGASANAISVNLKNSQYTPNREIYAVRVGYSVGDNDYISSNMKYYNSDNCSPYTDNIYVFDGIINDYYITSNSELENVMYYSYINRIESFNIKISEGLKSRYMAEYPSSHMVYTMNDAVDNAMESYYETQAYYPANINNGFVQQLSNAYEYNIKVSYYGVKECDVSIPVSSSYVYPQANNSGYYEMVDYDMLGSSFDNFVSDHYFLTTKCSTSEQLYWAVENKITPIVVDGSRADIIYKKAKDVLRNIISPEMTDYEKALSIFDWISLNTNYDHTNYDNVYRGGVSLGNLPMYLPCFYLEGVFMTGYSVCDGFSKAYSLMCNMMGIDTIRIVGTAVANGERGGHAWNKVLIDDNLTDELPGKYYLVDITWTEILSEDDEVLSHMYFLLSDNDVKNTHFNYAGRDNKFKNYAAMENYYFYDNGNFDYFDNFNKTTKTYNWVVENNEELRDLFYYTLDNSLSSVEFVVDIDYMKSYYEYVNGVGSYCKVPTNSFGIPIEYKTEYYVGTNIPQTKYHYATDTLIVYKYTGVQTYEQEYKYYELRKNFIECMRSLKFNEQYFTITNFQGEIVYNEDGEVGVLYILEQNLRLDNNNDNNIENEVSHLFEYFATYNITGDFALYVDGSLLKNVNGSGYVTKLQNLISSAISDLNISIKYIGIEENMHKFNIVIN